MSEVVECLPFNLKYHVTCKNVILYIMFIPDIPKNILRILKKYLNISIFLTYLKLGKFWKYLADYLISKWFLDCWKKLIIYSPIINVMN